MSERVVTDERRLTTILSVDVCGYTALSERDGGAARAAVRTLTARMDEVAAAHQGRVFHRAGDGFLAEFPSATCGVEAAVALHASLNEAPIRAAGDPIHIRAGVHTGEVAVEANGDLLGHAVNVASRLQSEAHPGGTMISATTRELSGAGIATRRVGDLKLRNIREPVTAYVVTRSRGPVAWARGLLPRGWTKRNAGVLRLGAALLVLAALGVAVQAERRDRAREAALAEAARQADIEEEAARLAETLVPEEDRLVDRQVMRLVTTNLLRSGDPRKTAAIDRLVGGEPLAAAIQLRAVYDAQTAAGEPDADRLRTALEVGAMAKSRDQALAQWAYEEADAIAPDEPYVLRHLADIAVDRGEREAARVYLGALLATDPSPGDQVHAHNQLGHIASQAHDFDEAERRYRVALTIARAHDLAREQAQCLRNLGAASTNRAQIALVAGEPAEDLFDEARTRLRQALRLARAVDDAGLMAAVYNSLGVIEQANGDLDAAQGYFDRRLTLAEQAGDQAQISSVAFNLASLANRLGEASARDRYLARARAAAEAGRIDGMLGYIALNEAFFAAADGEGERACDVLRQNRAVIDIEDDGAKQQLAMIGPIPCERAVVLARDER